MNDVIEHDAARRRHARPARRLDRARRDHDPIFSFQELARLDEALTMSSRETGLRFTLYIGDLGPRTRIRGRGAARPSGGNLAESVLIAVSPGQRVVEVVTGAAAARRIPDRACALAVLSMTGSFAAGDLVGGIVNGLRQMSDQAGHPPALRHPYWTARPQSRSRDERTAPRPPGAEEPAARSVGRADLGACASASRSRARRARAMPSRPSKISRRSGGGWSASASHASAADDRARLDDRREQVLDGVLRDLAGPPVPQRADLGEVPLHVLGGELALRRVPEAQQHRLVHGVGHRVVVEGPLPGLRLRLRRRAQRPGGRGAPHAGRGGVALVLGVDLGVAGARRWRPARTGTPSARRRRPPGPRSSVTRRAARAGRRRARRCGRRWRRCATTAAARRCRPAPPRGRPARGRRASSSRWAPTTGRRRRSAPSARRASSDWTTLISVSASTPASTSCTHSRAGSSASRVMSQAADQHSARGQRVGEGADARAQRGQRPLVEAELGVGEVVVVDQHEVGRRVADQLGHLGARAGDVQLHARGAGEPVRAPRCRGRPPAGGCAAPGARPRRSARW